MIHVRPYSPDDRPFVVGLAPRLTVGMRPWRNQSLWLAAVHGWIDASLATHGQDSFVFVAEDAQGERLGFASVARSSHFSGQPQAYLGELAISATAQGQGVGAALVAACEQWARDQGYTMLALATGATNTRALGFYHRLGFQDEDVTLVKLL